MAVEIARSGKNISFYSVDHWYGSAGETAHAEDPDVRNGRLFEIYTHNIEPVSGYVTPVRSDSSFAATMFVDGTVDFLYLDAAHSYSSVTRDLRSWWPKLKIGATIAGDDWVFRDEETGELSVQKAVIDFLGGVGVAPDVLPGDPAKEWQQWIATKESGRARL